MIDIGDRKQLFIDELQSLAKKARIGLAYLVNAINRPIRLIFDSRWTASNGQK